MTDAAIAPLLVADDRAALAVTTETASRSRVALIAVGVRVLDAVPAAAARRGVRRGLPRGPRRLFRRHHRA